MATNGLRSREWELSYRGSSIGADANPVDVLHDFYIPALGLATSYDRVAGYFRSSSLAAASQGFTAFAGRGGIMRLIVGADLEPVDVAAVLAGDEMRLAQRLNASLASPQLWPQAELNGVQLLGALVASGQLEMKVAFRVHGKTGLPIGWEDVTDGYVHEKWFIMGDELGNMIYGAGSLNESRTALVLNAENVDIHCTWWGQRDRLRVTRAVNDFQAVWSNKRPHMPVLPLPEAVRRNLVRFSENAGPLIEIDGSSAGKLRTERQTDSGVMPALERLQWALLQDGPLLPDGRWVGLATAPVEPWPHQTVVVRRMVENYPYSFLLCDEVGLGKTIEAGLAFRCLYLSGLAKRILVAAPASLTKQWLQQMAEKVLLPFALLEGSPVQQHSYLLPSESADRASAPFAPDLLIVSTGLLERQERQRQFSAAEAFDIALVDEAHNARRSNSTKGFEAAPDYGALYRFVHDVLRPHCKALYLATATPLQLHTIEVYDLLVLTRRGGAYLEDPTLLGSYYQLLQRLRQGEQLEAYEWVFLLNNVQHLRRQDPNYWGYLEQTILRSKRARQALDDWEGFAEQEAEPIRRTQPEIGRLLTQIAPFSRVMLRHSRSLLKVYSEKGKLEQRLAQRSVQPQFVSFNPAEKAVYEGLEQYCQGLQEVIARCSGDSRGNTLMFYLSFLRQRFASSLYAIERTLERRLERVQQTLEHHLTYEVTDSEAEEQEAFDWDTADNEVAAKVLLKDRTKQDLRWEAEHVQALLDKLHNLDGLPSKVVKLLQLLEERRLPNQPDRVRQLVVFTRYFDTLNHLREQLRRADPRLRVGIYSGVELSYFDANKHRWVMSSREEVKQRFLREEIDILLCTDAAAEGLNLQTADTLVNFDMGWNPMKLEQRIGRIDRIGQQHPVVFIHNYFYLGSVEEKVYNRLLNRLGQAGLVVGEQQVSMLPVTPEDFAKLAAHEIDEDFLLEEAKKRFKEQRASAAAQELSPEEIYELYEQLNEGWERQPPPVSLGDIEQLFTKSVWLNHLGAKLESVIDSEGAVQTLLWCPTLVASAGFSQQAPPQLLTWDRNLYERGLPDENKKPLFGSYGEPVFDSLVEHANRFGLPKCIKRLTIAIPGLPGREQVGYAVAVQAADGYEVQLVTSLNDAFRLELAEQVELTAADVQPAENQLKRVVLHETQTLETASQIERQNVIAGKAQNIFALEIGAGLLNEKKADTYSKSMRELRDFFENRPRMLVPRLPIKHMREISEHLLISPDIPAISSTVDYTVSRLLAASALDAVSRRLSRRTTDRRSLEWQQAMKAIQNAVQEQMWQYRRL